MRVFTPTVDEHGWSTGHTVIEIVTDDMPFLVDSVTAELGREGRALHLVVHPQLAVRRDATGRLVEILDVEAGHGAKELPFDAAVESWMHLEIDRESDPGRLTRRWPPGPGGPGRRPGRRRGLAQDVPDRP